ncbi:integrator complex subunit 14 [Galendromus occidentalis]|uniref:Integrator complex subunit 14 n=1 Tax=Galendromus occidentalis TaxID=34638 RepID=A0AAJ7SD47_9ACAR|nr:integrator complex subunit 14 [Galendromus occidentalis]
MPTVFLVDASLSMCKPVSLQDRAEPMQIRHLAAEGLNHLLQYMAIHCKLEFCSVVVFSSLWEVVEPFTRDFDALRDRLTRLQFYDKTNIEVGIEGAKHAVLQEWGASCSCQIVLVTDGCTPRCLPQLNSPLFPFPCKLHIVPLCEPGSPQLKASLPFYQKLIDSTGNGAIVLPEGGLSLKSVNQAFVSIGESSYVSWQGRLVCGHLESHVTLCPPPDPQIKRVYDFEQITVKMSDTIEICGFMSIPDVAHPATVSRHLVLPIPAPKPDQSETSPTPENAQLRIEDGGMDDEAADDGKQPSFCVLLHGSLKVESMVAVCKLGASWYGMLYSWADSKKKSNLMLSTFEPGEGSVPWWTSVSSLGSNMIEKLKLPIKPAEKPSYSMNSVVWIRTTGLQADIQKILRHARKLPEKMSAFYKELNRLRRAAISYGFYDLLETMSSILERECTLLPGTQHPEAALQLSHAASQLKVTAGELPDIDTPIAPLKTKLSSSYMD